jgi:predicted nucleic acid-binding protein
VDGAVRLEDLPNDGDFVATHVQIDELNKTKDEERRARLLLKFATLRPEVAPTESFVIGTSRIGFGKLGSGVYDSLKDALDARKPKPNNIQDALIAEVATQNGYVLITGDADLAQVAEDHGCKVLHYVP